MICQFSFKNFKSYKDETVFDMQAETLPEFNESLIRLEKCSPLLPVSVIYGPNGGGKSNLLDALTCLISTVVKPIYDLSKNILPLIFQIQVECTPFVFDDASAKEPTEFQVYFRTNGYEYRYNISLLNHEVVYESLSRKVFGGKKPARVFERDGAGISLGSMLKDVNRQVNSKMPYLSFLAINYNIDVIKDVQQWFESCIVASYSDSETEKQIFWQYDEPFWKLILQAFNDMGIEITGARYDEKEKQFYLERTLHDKKYELPIESESNGTQKLFSALPLAIMALKDGRLLIVDELDAKLHPKLLRYLIALFKNVQINKHGAQLLFTSHDMTTMKNSVFRRDEIWFAARNDELSSEIYSLCDIRGEDNKRVNHTAAYDKQYLEGRYGADPYLQNMLSGGEWN